MVLNASSVCLRSLTSRTAYASDDGMYGMEKPAPASLSVSFRHHAVDCGFLTTCDEKLLFLPKLIYSTFWRIPMMAAVSVRCTSIMLGSVGLVRGGSYLWGSFRHCMRWGQHFAFVARVTSAKSTEHWVDSTSSALSTFDSFLSI